MGVSVKMASMTDLAGQRATIFEIDRISIEGGVFEITVTLLFIVYAYSAIDMSGSI